MNFHIETYGCTANFGNSEEAKATLMEYGHQPSSLEDADIVIINTCAVTAKTERKIKRRLQELNDDRLIVAGCLPASPVTAKCGARSRIRARSPAQPGSGG